MKRISLLLFIAICFGNAIAQFRTDIGINMGVANYLGEIGGTDKTAQPWIMDIRMGQTRPSIGAYVRTKLRNRHLRYNSLYLRADLNHARLQGADSISVNPARVARNLSFRNDVWELLGRVEFSFLEINDVSRGRRRLDFKSYASLGIGLFWNNPKANLNGTWYALQPLRTEGRRYSRVQFTIPVAAGFNYTYKHRHRFGFELGWRLTFTDYMDDISDRYVEPESIESPIGTTLANRSAGKAGVYGYPGEANYSADSPRGNPARHDSYFVASLSYSFVCKGKYRLDRIYGMNWRRPPRTKVNYDRPKF